MDRCCFERCVSSDEQVLRSRLDAMDIASMLEVQVKEETNVKENVTPGNDQSSSETSTSNPPISQEESNYYKLIFGNDIASVRFHRIHCTACDVHIGSAPAQAHNMFEHPVLRTLLCSNCRDFYGDGTFEQGDDATDMFCRWCANGGNLYCCSYCSNTFCYKCIRRNFTSLVRKKIEADEKWKCFVCNPSDLFSARALCWALLQHVQTVTRILAHDKKMSAQEIEEKMNLDESPCCPRRSKRKLRKLRLDSEEEEMYPAKWITKYNVKRKINRKKPSGYTITNGILTREIQPYRPPIPIRPRPPFLSGQSFNAEPSKSTVSHENSVVQNPESIILPSSNMIKSSTSLPSRFDSNTLQQQPSLYHTSFMNPSRSTTYIQTPVGINSTTRIILPSQSQPQLTPYQSQQANSYQPQQMSSFQSQQTSSYQPQQPNLYQPQQTSSCPPQQASSYQSSQSHQPSPNTMVTIPNPVDKHGRPIFLLPKPKELDVTPNVIELDSDSDDEPRVVTQQNNSMIDKSRSMNVNISSDKVVPVALTWENSDEDIMREEQPLREIRATVEKNISLSKILLPHSQEVDKLLSDAKKKIYNLFDLDDTIENIEVEAQQRINNFCHNMRDTIFQLVHINDRIIRQYAEWRRSQKMETEVSSSTNENQLVSQENIDIPLDMICVNDSDTESECEDQKYQIMKPSDLIKDSNIIKYLLFCKTNVVHRGVSDDTVQLTTTDKAIQVYDTVSRDYEKDIDYFTKTGSTLDQDPKTNESISNRLVRSNKNFSKYEEQFIFYLQHMKDDDIKTIENTEGEESDGMSLQEMIQTNSPFISDLYQDIDIDLPVASTDQSKNCQEESLSDSINSVTKDKSNTLNENNKEIVSNHSTIEVKTNMQLDDKLQQIESQRTPADITNGEAIMLDNNKVNSNKNNIIEMEIVASIGSEEDYTIIND